MHHPLNNHPLWHHHPPIPFSVLKFDFFVDSSLEWIPRNDDELEVGVSIFLEN